MQSGTLDRRLRIEVNTPVRDTAGQPIAAWSTFATVWARKIEQKGDERHAGDRDLAVRAGRFRMYWLAGVHERMRLVDLTDGVTYQEITAIASDRRRNWMEITAEARDPETSA